MSWVGGVTWPRTKGGGGGDYTDVRMLTMTSCSLAACQALCQRWELSTSSSQKRSGIYLLLTEKETETQGLSSTLGHTEDMCQC